MVVTYWYKTRQTSISLASLALVHEMRRRNKNATYL